MLPGIGTGEYVIIALLALIVIGPKDLPMLMRKLGGFINRLRGMAAEFRASFDEMARQSELDELRKQVEELRSGQLMQPISDEIAPAMTAIETDIRQDWTGAGASPAVEVPTAAPAPKKRKAATTAKTPAAKAAKPAAAKPAKGAFKKPVAPKPTKAPAKPPAKPKPRGKGAKS